MHVPEGRGGGMHVPEGRGGLMHVTYLDEMPPT